MISLSQAHRFLSWWGESHSDIYAEPVIDGHLFSTIQTMDTFWQSDWKTVLDVGCGQGVAFNAFRQRGVSWKGLTLGPDFRECEQLGYPVLNADFHDTRQPCASFDVVWARHVLEHSIAPFLALKEWHRVSKHWLVVVTPRPPHFEDFHNHYTIMNQRQWEFVFRRTGWKIFQADHAGDQLGIELRWLLEKDQ